MYTGQSHLYELAKQASDQLVHRSQDGPHDAAPSLDVLCRAVGVIESNRERVGGPPAGLMQLLGRALYRLRDGPVTHERAATVRQLVHSILQPDRVTAQTWQTAQELALRLEPTADRRD